MMTELTQAGSDQREVDLDVQLRAQYAREEALAAHQHVAIARMVEYVTAGHSR